MIMLDNMDQFTPTKRLFIGIDSDGCVFDTMELKHKECFIPNTIRLFGLQAISECAREVAEFVNLYSHFRGINRFPGLLKTLDMLRSHPQVASRDVEVPVLPATRDWLLHEPKPSGHGLKAVVGCASDETKAELSLVLEWSEAVNDSVSRIVSGLPPFPLVREVLQLASEKADIVVLSATPFEALVREWSQSNLTDYIDGIAGQEAGTKADLLQAVICKGYTPDCVLMIGDAPGDLQAAAKNGVHFYPVNPGDESQSWSRFHDEALPRFLSGDYDAAYQAERMREFQALLPSSPPWFSA